MSDKASEYSDMDIQLELKDRLNYSYVIQATLVNFKKAIFNRNADRAFIEALLWDFLTDIPTSWYDKKFLREMQVAFITKEVDIRPDWGGVKLSVDICKEEGYPITETITELNPFLMKNAIINLLHRRDMLVRKKKIEQTTGKNLKYLTLDSLPDAQDDYEDSDLLTVGDSKLQKEIQKEKEVKKQ